MTGSPKPQRKSKVELEMLIKAHGGRILQSYGPDISLICLGAKGYSFVSRNMIGWAPKLIISSPQTQYLFLH